MNSVKTSASTSSNVQLTSASPSAQPTTSTTPPAQLTTDAPENVPTAASPTSTTPSGTAVGAAEASNTGFNMPGKKLSVLPIGLGVFAGISVIALIVVGLVTYERTKYRKVRTPF